MFFSIKTLTFIVLLAPLLGGLVAANSQRLKAGIAQAVTIFSLTISFFSALILFCLFITHSAFSQEFLLYTWAVSGLHQFNIGLLVDNLTVAMMLMVTFISLFVHIYSIGYMKGDKAQARFFAYMSLFTFSMLCIVSAHDFILLFFGWEGVGLISYLLIGFWYERESAAMGGFKAFIVNRVGDMGFLLAIACAIVYFGSADYADVFSQVANRSAETISIIPGLSFSLLTVMSILLFIGAAAKSAQVPLHVWLPESMEGPTPISALIHAATMVTAGVFMLCRLSPVLEYSTTALTLVLVLGAITALFMGLVGLVQNDIKRVIAYSTLSQLGYMMMGVGSTAYAAGLFHLFTHAFFKALLFLAAGSVIIGMHHEQDMRYMGGLRKYMPITWLTFLIGALALCAIPPFSGFYSKDTIIEALHVSMIPGAHFAYVCAVLGAGVTALYTFRAFLMTFHGKARFDIKKMAVKESSYFMLIPLIILAIPSIIIGFIGIEPFVFSKQSLFNESLFLLPGKDALSLLRLDFHGALSMMLMSIHSISLWVTLFGLACAIYFYGSYPFNKAIRMKACFSKLYKILELKYGFDDFNRVFIVKPLCFLARFAYHFIDQKGIEGMIHRFAFAFSAISSRLSRMHSGLIGRYAFSMVYGLFILILIIFTGI